MRIPIKWLAASLLFLSVALPVHAAQINIIGPARSVNFGRSITVLPNGNIVVTATNGPVSNAGTVYLYNPNGSLISTITGSSLSDNVGSGGIHVLDNGNYVILSPSWRNGAASSAGAVTWASAVTGVSGVVSPVNSVVGSRSSDRVGSGGIRLLANGHFLILSPDWNNGTQQAAGAVTWANAVFACQ